ncbi:MULTISPECIES: GIY-YIG nuclease family protein [unclassified Brevundimonas]|uniref:GIY-YIG nuclease family protein n=1 Tax=unclassified Brevundimonas TaxID=2622653 RepID=UPI0025C0CD86|nr:MULTISPECIES: hypothetical protein [unclassified Brevundimonas]
MQTYTIQPVSAMRAHPEMIPDVGGLYALILDHPEELDPSLDRAGLKLEEVFLSGRHVLYIGATGHSLRRRLKHHLADDTCMSTFRMSLGAVLMEALGLEVRARPGQRYFGFEPHSEALLSAWIAEHVSVAVRPHARARDVEQRLIARAQPPLNIAGRGANEGAAEMARLRRRCRGLPLQPGTLN